LDDKKSVKIILEREWCNKNDGPHYSLTIDSKGTVEYHGISNVKTVGKHFTKITQQELNSLIDDIKIIYFFSLKDSYGDCTDTINLQQITISAQVGNDDKKITYGNASRVPYSLKLLEKKIEKITNASKWIGSERNV
jgi:hypothetical protein